jgi:hypothetical protein
MSNMPADHYNTVSLLMNDNLNRATSGPVRPTTATEQLPRRAKKVRVKGGWQWVGIGACLRVAGPGVLEPSNGRCFLPR